MSIEINGKQYISMAQAADDLNVSVYFIRNAIKNGVTSIERREKSAHRKRKPVTFNGKTYISIGEAAKELNYSYSYLHRMAKQGITDIEYRDEKQYGNCGGGKAIRVTDCEGNVYKSQREMDRQCGFSQSTTSTRIRAGRKLTTTKQTGSRKTNGVFRYDVYYKGVIYHGFHNARKFLHHNEAWILKNCHLIPVYIDEWKSTDIENGLWYDIKNIMYRPMQWNEDRIIAECDRRMKKLFTHGKLIKHKADVNETAFK